MNTDTNLALSAAQINALCQQYVTLVYKDINATLGEQDYIISQTSGEILYSSIDKLIAKLSLNESDVFVDLGSGLGKTLIYFFLKTHVREAQGIEIIPILYQGSLLAAQRIQQELPEFFDSERKLNFFQGDFLKFPLTNATVVFLCSTCFDQELLCSIGEVINNTPNIHTVLTFRPIASLQRLSLHQVVNVESSWSSALCYIYRNNK